MGALLYLTVWISLTLFAIAELGRDRTKRSWPHVMSASGLSLMVLHIVMAMGGRHDWQHASAVAATAQQTHEVYGLNWGGGVYANYVFAIAWGLWMVPGFRGARVPRYWVRITRVFFLVVIANAAIVFAAGWRRLLGVAIVAMLVYGWSTRTVPATSGARPSRPTDSSS